MATNKTKKSKNNFNQQLLADSERKKFNDKFYQKLKHNISEERYQEAVMNQNNLR